MTHGAARENLVIMEAVSLKFGKQGLVSISKSLAIFLGLLFVGCLIATGLLVYNFSSCSNENLTQPPRPEVQERKTIVCDKSYEKISSTTETTTLKTTTTATESSSKKTDLDLDVRLPKSVIPHSYKIALIPFLLEGNFTFHGNVTILVNVTENTRNITLHAQDLEVFTVRVYDENHDIPIKDIRTITQKQFLVIDLDATIQKDRQYFLHIQFTGILNDLMQGFYRSSYEENNQTRWIAATQFQATDARQAFPCFDEPVLKARFQISIARLQNMSSISNMPKNPDSNLEPVENLPDYVWDHYEESLPMSTYLIAFIVSDFENITNGNFSIWARKSALSQANYSLSIGPLILTYYEKFFGIKYPLPKLDMVAIPDFPAGAMENWGLITYREPVLLYEEGVSSKASLQRIAHVVAHELAHQWFGNLVTPIWWTDLWLNEGFATFVEFLGANEVEPSWKDLDLFLVSEMHGSFELDALKSSHQISIKVNNPDEVNDIFDRISYSKGASIIRMMQHFLTAGVFHVGLNKYLNSSLYGNAEQDDLWRFLTAQSHEDGVLDSSVTVKEIMDTWTLQTGFPVVSVIRNYDESSVTFDQERYLLDKRNLDGIKTMWWIPITYTDSRQQLGSTWLRKVPSITKEVQTSPEDWILVNINQTGYYRVNYDLVNWKLIVSQLQSKNGHLVFDPKNRAQLLDDVLNLAVTGYVDYDLALNVTEYLKQEKEYVPWKAALNNLDYIYDMFERTGHFDKFKIYMTNLIKNFYTDLGFKENTDDSTLDVLSRMEIARKACQLGVRDCIIRAVQQFQNWKNSANPDKDNTISPDLREIVYCTAISEGGQDEWDFAWQRYLNTNVANEKEILLTALGCSKEIWILSRYLDWAITDNSGIRKHDSPRVFAAVSENPVGQDLTYRFLKTNWDRIRSYLGRSSMSISSLVRTSTAKFNTKEEINDFKRFLNSRYDEFGIALRTAQQSIEQAEANERWMEQNFQKIVFWLTEKNRVVF